MQLDPSLITGTSPRPAPATTFNQAAQNVMQLKQMAQQGEMAKIQLAQAQQQQSDQTKLSDIARQATTIGPDGKPVFNSDAVPGLMGQQGMGGAIEADQKNREFTMKLESMKLDRAKKAKDMAAENRKRMAGILGSIVDEPSRQRAITEIESDPDLSGAYPLDLITKPYDPNTSPGLYEKMTGLYLDPNEQRMRTTEKRNQFESDRSAQIALQGQAGTMQRADTANDLQRQQNITNTERQANNEFDTTTTNFRQLQTGVQKIRTFADMLTPNGTYKKPPKNEAQVDKGLVDSFALYGFANIKDAKGAVMSSDITVTTAGRSLMDSFNTGMDKLISGAGQLSPKERLSIVKVSEIYYQAQRKSNETIRQSVKNFIKAHGGNPSLVANSGYLPGEEPPELGALGTEPSTVPGSAPSAAMPAATGSSAPQPETSPQGSPAAKTRPASAPPDATLAPDGKWYSKDPKRPGKYILWE